MLNFLIIETSLCEKQKHDADRVIADSDCLTACFNLVCPKAAKAAAETDFTKWKPVNFKQHKLQYRVSKSTGFHHLLEVSCSCSPDDWFREVHTSRPIKRIQRLFSWPVMQWSVWGTGRGRRLKEINVLLHLYASLVGGKRTLRKLGEIVGCGSFDQGFWTRHTEYLHQHASKICKRNCK